MASQMVVPASTDTLFFRNFMSNQGKDPVCDFFEREANSPVHVEFFKQSDIDGRLYIALRFESKDIAKDILNRFDGQVVLGDRIQVSWFKDLRKARQKHHFHDRRYGRQGGRGGSWNSGGGGGDYYRSNREWEEESYRRGSDGYDRDYNYRGASNRGGRQRRHSSSERHHRSSKYDRSSSRSASRSRSPTPERRARDSRSTSPAIKEKRRRSKSQKNEGTLRSTVREVSPAKSDRSVSKDRSRSRDERDDDDKDWGASKRGGEYSDYERSSKRRESTSPEKSPPPSRSQQQSPPSGRNTSPPPKAYRDPRSDKFTRQYYPSQEEKEERRSVLMAKQQDAGDEYGSRGGYQDYRSYSPTSSNPRREPSPPPREPAPYSRSKQQEPAQDFNTESAMETGNGRRTRTRSPELRHPKSRHPDDVPDPRREAFQVSREPMDTADPEVDIKRRKKEAAPDPWPQQQQQQQSQQRPSSRVPPSDPILPGLNGGLSRELDRVVGDFGLSSQKMGLLKDKKEDIERAYRNDCETFATVVKMLISKDPLLEDKLQLSLRENLKDIGQRCIYELREYIDRIRMDDQ